MFTGITEHVGKIESLARTPASARLVVSLGAAGKDTSAPEIAQGMKLGDSIAVNGCCLTVVEFDKKHFSADLSGETLSRTNIGEKKPGAVVNLERPLQAGARLGGHFMQGHVDGTGRVMRNEAEGDNFWLAIKVPAELQRYVAPKGSIAIDGISLTVAKWDDGVASIAIIPFTHAHTNVHAMVPGDAVNLETDILAKYVEGLLGNARASSTPAAPLSVKKLVEEGF